MERGSAGSGLPGVGRLEAVRRELDAQARRFEEAKARLQGTAGQVQERRPRPEIPRDSAYARMQARLEAMPVIEQAKGILMAQQRCGPDEALGLLRQAAQQANVEVRVLAAQVVARVAAHATKNRAMAARTAAKGAPGRARSPAPILN